jgi:hypothetical protein
MAYCSELSDREDLVVNNLSKSTKLTIHGSQLAIDCGEERLILCKK